MLNKEEYIEQMYLNQKIKKITNYILQPMIYLKLNKLKNMKKVRILIFQLNQNMVKMKIIRLYYIKM